MPFNGSGTFSRVYNWVTDKNSAINITASRMDTEDNGFATGLSNCILKDGTQTVTANIPMNSHKFTGLSVGSAATDSATIGQIQNQIFNWIAGGGTADVITATYSPAVTAVVDGMELSFRATAANTTATPTFSPNGLTARTIVKNGGQALAAGDIRAINHELILRYCAANTRWELLNPYCLPNAGGTLTGALVTAASTTGTAGLNVPAGTAPTSPVNGDIWTTTAEMLVRINGTTYTLQRRELYTIGGAVGVVGSGYNDSTTTARIFIPFKFRLTTAPTGISVANVANFGVQDSSAVDQACSSITFISANKDGITVAATVASGLIKGNGTLLDATNANAVITLTGGAI